MSAPRAEVNLDLNASRFTQGANQAEQSFGRLGEAGRRTLDNISQKSGQATGSMATMGTRGSQAFNQVGVAAQNASAKVTQTAAAMNASRAASVGMAGSLVGLGASFVSLETSLTNMPKRLNAIEKAEINMARTKDLVANKTARLEGLEIKLDKARAKGNKTAAEIALMEQKVINTKQELITASADLTAKTEDLNLKQADYADTLKLFASSVVTTFVSAGIGVVSMLTQMATNANMATSAFIRTKLATLAQSHVLKILRIDLAGASIALKGFATGMVATGTGSMVAVTGIRRLALGVKGLYLSLGPIGWGIIGITLAMEAWNSNLVWGAAGSAVVDRGIVKALGIPEMDRPRDRPCR